jgi:hypothetical protein
MKTKANNPVTVALVLWLLFCATNAFAVLKSPFPRKPQAPDQTTIVADSRVEAVGTANKPE